MAIKDRIENLLRDAFEKAQFNGVLPQVNLPDALVERPQNPDHGDYSVTAPLKLARTARMSPLAIAHHIVDNLEPAREIDRVTVAEPGFINIFLNHEWLKTQVDAIIEADTEFGDLTIGTDIRVQVEYVSVNPTGPLHVGHGRGAVLGSALARILKAAGYSVEEEYYINDAGTQMDIFYRSLYARYLQELGRDCNMPSDGYMGLYIIDLAKEIYSEEGDRFEGVNEHIAIQELGALGLKKMLASIRADLGSIRVVHDVWFSEKSLFDSGQYTETLEKLTQKGYIQEKDGATWFASTALGEDKDNVLVRGSGHPTYFATDIAYHYNKLSKRGFDKVINIWGADHQGHISRMKTAVEALGIDPARLEIIVSQMVTLKRGDNVVKVSKRSGDIITLRDVIREVGSDPCRFFFLARSADSQMDFDLELAKANTADNPAYYLQYAHARMCSILRHAEERGIDFSNGDVSLLGKDPEMGLIREMLKLPEAVELITKTLEPQHLPYYAQDLAAQFHSFYEKCRVVGEDLNISKARLKLVKSSQIVLAKSLYLMSMAAPERM